MENEKLKQKLDEAIVELEQYKQTCIDWNVWSKGKTIEYEQLLEAFNQYVEAYNNVKAEFDSVLEQPLKTEDDTKQQKQYFEEHLHLIQNVNILSRKFHDGIPD